MSPLELETNLCIGALVDILLNQLEKLEAAKAA